MELRANSFAVALLVLLLAVRATDAAPHNDETNTASRNRTAFGPAAAEVELAQQEGPAAVNEEEDGEEHAGPMSWYKLLPRTPEGDQRNSEAAVNVSNLKEKWEALTSQIVQHIRASAENEKVPVLLEKLNDPVIRKNLLGAALAAAGMTATGLMLGDYGLLRQMSLMSLYVTAFLQLLRSGANLANKLASDASEEQRAARTDRLARHKLAKLFGVRPEGHSTLEEADDQ